MQAEFAALSQRMKQQATRHRAPEALQARIAALAPAPAPTVPRRRSPIWAAAPFGAGVALAAAILLAVLPLDRDRVPDEITSDHIRALQPGHLLDVVSTDRHTVKPWFAGKLDFAPTVRDLADQGFPLKGGRLDTIGGRAVAVLVYARRGHMIDVYVWPADRAVQPGETRRNGFNLISWRQGELVYCAVSDLDEAELASFTGLMASES